MAETFRWALAGHVTCRKTNTELRMLFDREKGVMYEFNETGSAIIEALDSGPKSRDELLAHLQQVFEAPREEIIIDMDDFVADIHRAGLLVQRQEG